MIVTSLNAGGGYRLRFAIVAIGVAIAAADSRAVTLKVDYTYDTSNFFGAGNPSGAAAGAQAKSALEAVATFYSGILQDTFSAIQTPPNFASSQFNGVAFWHWDLTFPHPATGSQVTLQDQTIPANEYRIYAGARNLGSGTLGVGGPGGYGWNSGSNGGGFTQGELNSIDTITTNFTNSVETRGETTGFANWGGAVTFDITGVTWNYNHQVAPVAGQNDFFSVAVHELGHALGLGASSEWNMLISGFEFLGPAATAEYGSNPPVNGGHWASGTMSRILGTNTPQEAAMDPEITVGTRKRLTALDAAALEDIGWTVGAPPSLNPADFNQDGIVNGGDLTIWRTAFAATANGNADGDADTDGNDFLFWQRNVGKTSVVPSGIASFAAVPEPGAAVLVLSALFAGLRIHHVRR